MNEKMMTQIWGELRSLSKEELVEMILFLMLESRYNTADGCDLSDVARTIRRETLTRKIDAILEENDRLLERLSELRKSPPKTSMESISILNRLRDNYDKCARSSAQLNGLGTA